MHALHTRANLRSFLPALGILLGSSGYAQELGALVDPEAPARVLSSERDWLLPIHSAPNDPVRERYGLWASGPNYKVSFGKSVAFHPLLGEAGENAPVRWTTRSIAVGGVELLDDGAEPAVEHGEWRYTLHHGAVDEIYDVKAEGLEQSFRLHERPVIAGDLVIEGAIESSLVAAERSLEHGAIDFAREGGAPLVSYGAAIAIDALGRTAPVLSSFQDGAIRLQLCGAWIAEASFPLVVDPLLTRYTVTSNGPIVGAVDIAFEGENDMFLVARERLFAIGDYDLSSSVVGRNGGLLSSAFSDIAAGWNTLHPSCAYVGGVDKWVLAFERVFPLPSSANVYVYLQDDGIAAPFGVVRQVSSPAGSHQRYPSVGGASSFGLGDQALVVYQEDLGGALIDTEESRVRGTLLDAGAATFGPTFAISIDAAGHDCEKPCVSRSTGGSLDPWLVAYQQWNSANPADDWDILGRLVREDGAVSNREILAAGLSGEHALWPQVDGTRGRFLVLHGAVPSVQKSHTEDFRTVRAQRVNWEFNAAAPTFPAARRMLRTAASNVYSFGRPGSRPIAYNYASQSHWGLGWIESDRTLRSVRVGYDAGIVEDTVMYAQGTDTVRSVSVAFDSSSQNFAFAFGILDAAGTNPVYKRDLAFANAFQLAYGAGCQGTIHGYGPLGGSSTPYAGTEFFYLVLDNGVAFSPTALMIGLAPGSVPLGNGCTLLLDPASLFVVLTGVTNVAGDLGVQLSLVTGPIYEYDLYWQWLQIDAGSGQPVLSDALRTYIR